MSTPKLSDIPAVLLVGGLGTRLRSVLPSTPKPLAPMGDGSFLELLVRQLAHQGVRHLIMCTGYLADQVEQELGDGARFGVSIVYSRESTPLGTGGALRQAAGHLVGAPEFLVLNGDSFVEVKFQDLLEFHRLRGSLATIVVRLIEDAARFGTVEVDGEDRITRFTEKTGISAPGLVNAGVYAFQSRILDSIGDPPSSLERDVFPRLLGAGLYAVQQHGMFIDIGTPQDYERAREVGDRLREAAYPVSRHGQVRFEWS